MYAKQNIVLKEREDNSIVQAIGSYVPFWPLFFIFMILSAAGAYLYLRYTVPLYEATAKIIIKDENKGYDNAQLVESLDMINTKKIIENEIEVLQSQTLMNEVVKKLHLYSPVIQTGKVRSNSAYTLSPVTIEAFNPDSLLTFSHISIAYDKKNETVILDQTYRGQINHWLNTPFGKLRFIPNKRFSPFNEIKPFYFSIVPVKSVAGQILGNLKVTQSGKQSSVIDLSLRDEMPVRAEDILNELIISYSGAALKEKNTLAKNTLAFIEERLNIVARDMDTIELKLQQYKSGRGAVDISKQGQIYLENVSATDKKMTDINIQTAALDQLERSASQPGNIGAIPSTLGINDVTLLSQVSTLSSLQNQYEKLKATVPENNPILLSITDQMNLIKPNILKNIQSQRLSLQQNKNYVSATGGSYSSALSAIPQKERQLVEIARDQNIKNGIYSFLLQKREESELSLASNLSDNKVVNYAQASRTPVTPRKLIIYIASLAFALGFPILLIAAFEIFNPKILFRKEIENLTSIPVVSEISFNPTRNILINKTGTRTIEAEEFRKLRVSLSSLGIDGLHKKILITSNIAGEGKSYIAANLATTISFTGKKVVLVNLDLHNPGLEKILGRTEKIAGISDYLAGEKRLDEIIFKMEGFDSLYYIPSGALKKNSSELLENGLINSLISKLDSDFDSVIIDTAPIALITDGYLLSSLSDATLYVVRHKFTPKMFLKRIDNNAIINPIKNPGIVFNGVKTRGFFKNNYGYGYNYVYQYDYANTQKPLKKRFFNNSA
jgi:tyrosine-protein kinase Etk/Wzc